MLWFNMSKDLGMLRSDEGDRIEVPGEAFSSGARPVGRCAGKEVEFDSRNGVVSSVAFLTELSPRRARRRHRH